MASKKIQNTQKCVNNWCEIMTIKFTDKNHIFRNNIKESDMITNILTSNSTKHSPFEDESPQLFKKFPQISRNRPFYYCVRNIHRKYLKPVEPRRGFQQIFYMYLCIYTHLSRPSYPSVTFWLVRTSKYF
jgi:hypothetical protein